MLIRQFSADLMVEEQFGIAFARYVRTDSGGEIFQIMGQGVFPKPAALHGRLENLALKGERRWPGVRHTDCTYA